MRIPPRPRIASLRAAALPLMLGAFLCLGAAPDEARADDTDTLEFVPVEPVTDEPEAYVEPRPFDPARRRWLLVPFREHLHDDQRRGPRRRGEFDLELDYNRVDELRAGMTAQAQAPWDFAPRFAARIEYATGRRRWLYGAQLEQPLEPANRLAVGVSMSRTTDHLDLNQVDDFENSLALLFGRTDHRDYFEREGAEAYVAARWPRVSTMSVRYRAHRYRTLPDLDVRSWFHRDRTLRPNPAIDEGDARAVAVRLERRARRAGGLYHWIELESAGYGLGGDFEYRRAIADLRTWIRLAPAQSIALRAVGGSSLSGVLPAQRRFTIGGADGLRGHNTGSFRGNQVALGQIEYVIGFGRHRRGDFDAIHVIAFTDAGAAWTQAANRWNVEAQRFELDGGFGLGTAEDNLRVYFAKDLRDPDADFVISARLRRPF